MTTHSRLVTLATIIQETAMYVDCEQNLVTGTVV